MLHFFSLPLLLFCVYTKPNGAPGCKINETAITKGMGPQQDLGYQLQVRPGSTPTSFTIQITNSKTANYQGLLMYVAGQGSTNVHYGKFTFKNQTKWKYQDPAVCQRANVKQFMEGTLTHALPVPVPTAVLFTWTASSLQELSLPGLHIMSVVASVDGGKPKWQILAPVPIGRTVQTSQTVTPSDVPTSTSIENPPMTPSNDIPVPEPPTATISAETGLGKSLLLGFISLLL